MPDLAESIRLHMRDGGEPITFDEVIARADGRAAAGATSSVGRRIKIMNLRLQPHRRLSDIGGGQRNVRLPAAIAWAGVLVVVLAAIIVGVRVSNSHTPLSTLPTQKNHSLTKTLKVPDLLGVNLDHAYAALRAIGLSWQVHQAESQTIPGGEVLSQVPRAGTHVAKGSTVVLTQSSGPSSGTTVTTVPPTPSADGVYVDGSTGSPYYFVVLDSQSAGQVAGSVNFLYQDGQSSVVFTFAGTEQNGTATIHPVDIPEEGSASQPSATMPSSIEMSIPSDLLKVIDLQNCMAYLHFTSSTQQCIFEATTSGIGAATPDVPSGNYTDGAAGTPHYVMSLTRDADQLSGDLDYVYQDGRKSEVEFAFDGRMEGSVAILELGASGPSSTFPPPPHAVLALLGQRDLTFGECGTYLSFIPSSAQCTFALSGGG